MILGKMDATISLGVIAAEMDFVRPVRKEKGGIERCVYIYHLSFEYQFMYANVNIYIM